MNEIPISSIFFFLAYFRQPFRFLIKSACTAEYFYIDLKEKDFLKAWLPRYPCMQRNLASQSIGEGKWPGCSWRAESGMWKRPRSQARWLRPPSLVPISLLFQRLTGLERGTWLLCFC